MSRARDLADSADKDIAGTLTLDGLTVAGNVSVDGGTIKLDGNYPVGTGNVALGDGALDDASLSGGYNTAVGYQAGYSNTTGAENTLVGRRAGYNTTGSLNSALGSDALYANTTGANSVAIGLNSLSSNTTGSYNTGVGTSALQSNTTASQNTAVGYTAGYSNTTGAFNTFLGRESGYATTTGSSNTFVGANAGESVSTGTKNSILGRYNGNQGGLDIRTSSNYIVLSDGDGNPRQVIDSSGNVGIGTSSPSADLQVVGNIYESNGNIFTDSTSGIFFAGNGSYTNGVYGVGTNNVAFNTNGTERMRIDSSGNLLVGTTTLYPGQGNTSVGFMFEKPGTGYFSRAGGYPLGVNRNTNDGAIIRFSKDGSTVGEIGTAATDLTMGTTNTGIRFADGDSSWRPHNPATGGDRDNAIDIGSSGQRFDDIYATNGTIQTSDRNEKQDIEELSEAEQRVAVACKGLMRKYRWKDAVAEKGDDARIHFGIIAQDLQDAFSAEGLDAGRYAMFISTTWWETIENHTDDDGVEQTRTNTYETAEEAPSGATERTRLGVRYPELLAFIIAAI